MMTTELYYLRRSGLGRYVEFVGTPEEVAQEIGVDVDIDIPRERGSSIFTREELAASPDFADALAAWDRDDHELFATDIAYTYVNECGPYNNVGERSNLDAEIAEPRHRAILERYSALPVCRDALTCLDLRAAVDRIARAWEPGYVAMLEAELAATPGTADG